MQDRTIGLPAGVLGQAGRTMSTGGTDNKPGQKTGQVFRGGNLEHSNPDKLDNRLGNTGQAAVLVGQLGLATKDRD